MCMHIFAKTTNHRAIERDQDTHIQRVSEDVRLGASFCVSGALHSLDSWFACPNTW